MLLAVTIGSSFAFYGFRAYLAPYMAENFYVTLGPAAAQRQAYLLSSGFLAMMNATPIVGGYLADKILGEARALATSLWLTTLSLVLMALPTLFGLEIGMALFAMAFGFSIAPLTVLIGRNYSRSDTRRESGYTLWYLAVNLGAFIGPFICADFVGRRFGYRYGFIAAAAGNALAAIVFQLRQHKLRPSLPDGGHLGGSMAVTAVIVAITVLTYPMALLLSRPHLLSGSMYVLMALLILHIAVGCVRRRDHVQVQRYVALSLLFVALVLFWAFSFQGVTSLNFFARDHVSAPFDYTLFQSANPLYILIVAPLLALLWPWLARRGKDPSTPAKFGIGLLLVALSYGLMAAGIRYGAGADAKVAWYVLAGCYLLQTLGELALSPIGYSLIGLLAAPEESSLVMGGWYFGLALAYQSAGWIATGTIGAAGADPTAGMAGYAQIYGELFAIGLVASLVYLLATPWIRKLMHEVH